MPTNLASLESTLADRRARYGEFAAVASTTCFLTAEIFHAFQRSGKTPPPEQKVALEMICSKLARIANGDPNCHDSWHDIAGYATLVANTLQPEAE